jgi:hypothetical protein
MWAIASSSEKVAARRCTEEAFLASRGVVANAA